MLFLKYMKISKRRIFNVFEGEILYENGLSFNAIKVQLEVGSISICAFCSINSTCSTHYTCGSRNNFSYILFDSRKYLK